jgi:hypothetical protein
MFNTLGNLIEYPRAGLMFLDFASGDVLQLTGRTEIPFGPRREVVVHIDEVLAREAASPLRFGLLEPSPAHPQEPSHAAAAAICERRRHGQAHRMRRHRPRLFLRGEGGNRERADPEGDHARGPGALRPTGHAGAGGQGEDGDPDSVARRLSFAAVAVDDEELARRAAAGDEPAFGYRHLPSFRGEARFSTWLFRIVANAALMQRRARRRRPAESLESLLPRFDEQGRHVAEPAELEAAAHVEQPCGRTWRRRGSCARPRMRRCRPRSRNRCGGSWRGVRNDSDSRNLTDALFLL